MYGTFDASIAAESGNIVPLVPVARGTASEETAISMAELWHGPTYCFKDLGQQVLVRLLQYFVIKQSETETASQ